MKKLLSILAIALALGYPSRADNVGYQLTANVSSNLVANGLIADSIVLTATTTNITSVKFFDSATTTTNVVRPAYTSFLRYATNVVTTFTNEAGIVLVKTNAGIATLPTVNAAVTNALPTLATFSVPGSASRTITLQLQTIRGLTAVPDQDVFVEVYYRKNP